MTCDEDAVEHGAEIMARMRIWASVFAVLCFTGIASAQSNEKMDDVLGWLFKHQVDLEMVPFSDVIHASTGHTVLPVDRAKDAVVLGRIGGALSAVLARMNAADSAVQKANRINEASHFFEDSLLAELNKQRGFKAAFPLTAERKIQRSGYPDLELETEDGRVFYIDPKLYARHNRYSTLRTFYFEPRTATNKVNRSRSSHCGHRA